MESSPPPPPPPGPLFFPVSDRVIFLSQVHVGTTIPLLAVCLVPFFARIYVRAWPTWRFGLDDAFIVAGLLCSIADWALLEREIFLHPQNISFEEALCAVTLAYFAIPLWCLTMTLVKISIVLTLLRLPLRRAWKAGLYILLAVQFTFFLANMVYNFAKCTPRHAAWDYTVLIKQCPSEHVDTIVSHLGSAVNIATDLVLSVAPMFIFWNLRRPLRERILICSLTGVGLFATFASIMKVVVIAQWTEAGDRWATAVSIATWTITEQFVSVLAACSPSLKKPIEKLLNKFGIPLVEDDPYISFVHMPSRLRDENVRQQAREWLGDDMPPVNPAVPDSGEVGGEKKDIESHGLHVWEPEKSPSSSTSTAVLDTTTQRLQNPSEFRGSQTAGLR